MTIAASRGKVVRDPVIHSAARQLSSPATQQPGSPMERIQKEKS